MNDLQVVVPQSNYLRELTAYELFFFVCELGKMRDAEKARLHIARAQELLGQTDEMAFGGVQSFLRKLTSQTKTSPEIEETARKLVDYVSEVDCKDLEKTLDGIAHSTIQEKKDDLIKHCQSKKGKQRAQGDAQVQWAAIRDKIYKILNEQGSRYGTSWGEKIEKKMLEYARNKDRKTGLAFSRHQLKRDLIKILTKEPEKIQEPRRIDTAVSVSKGLEDTEESSSASATPPPPPPEGATPPPPEGATPPPR